MVRPVALPQRDQQQQLDGRATSQLGCKWVVVATGIPVSRKVDVVVVAVAIGGQ